MGHSANLVKHSVYRLLAIVAVSLFISHGGPAAAQQPSEYQVKAAFLYNFLNFVEWPQSVLNDTTLTIGILGTNPFKEAIRRFEARKVEGRSLRIVHSERLQDLPFCHILFVSNSEEKSFTQIFQYLSNQPTLTVGETEDFAQQGGIVNFFLQDKKVRFEINLQQSKDARLQLSSKLLKLARIVENERGEVSQ